MYSMLYIMRDWTKNTKVINIINATFEIITFNIDLFQGDVVSHNLLVVSEKINSDQTKLIPSNGSCCSSCHVHCHNGCCVQPCTCSHHPPLCVQVDRCHGGGWVRATLIIGHLTIAQQWWSQRSLFQVQFYKQNFRYKWKFQTNF